MIICILFSRKFKYYFDLFCFMFITFKLASFLIFVLILWHLIFCFWCKLSFFFIIVIKHETKTTFFLLFQCYLFLAMAVLAMISLLVSMFKPRFTTLFSQPKHFCWSSKLNIKTLKRNVQFGSEYWTNLVGSRFERQNESAKNEKLERWIGKKGLIRFF